MFTEIGPVQIEVLGIVTGRSSRSSSPNAAGRDRPDRSLPQRERFNDPERSRRTSTRSTERKCPKTPLAESRRKSPASSPSGPHARWMRLYPVIVLSLATVEIAGCDSRSRWPGTLRAVSDRHVGVGSVAGEVSVDGWAGDAKLFCDLLDSVSAFAVGADFFVHLPREFDLAWPEFGFLPA